MLLLLSMFNLSALYLYCLDMDALRDLMFVSIFAVVQQRSGDLL